MAQSFLLGKSLDSDLDALFKRSQVEPQEVQNVTSNKDTLTTKAGESKGAKTSNKKAHVKGAEEDAELDPVAEAARKARLFAQSLKNPDKKPSASVPASKSKSNPSKSDALKSSSKSSSKRPAQDDPDKNDRTLFIGNCPISCFQSHSSQKALRRHLIGCLPQKLRSCVTIESVRFRNLPLTSAIPAKSYRDASKKDNENDSKDDDDEKDNDETHARKRARVWKENEVVDDEDHEASTDKTSTVFLTPAQRKKLAYIKSDIHENVDSCTAYVVFALNNSSSSAEDNITIEGLKAQWIENADGTMFNEKTLRVDGATSRISDIRNKRSTGQVDASVAELHRIQAQEDQRSVFIGGLDFAENEENVRNLIESLLKEARGDPPSTLNNKVASDDDSDSDRNSEDDGKGNVAVVKRKPSWVKRVRIIRDKDTSLNKGFAYVLLENAECVDELLALEESKVKLSKRKLRLQRCKSSKQQLPKKTPSSKEDEKSEKKNKRKEDDKETKDDASSSKSNNKKEQKDKAKSIVTQKRDVTETAQWAANLAKITKDERRAIKSADEIRLARRADKKKAKIAEKRNQLEIEKAKKSSKTKHRPQQQKKHRIRNDRSELRKNTKK